MAQYSPPHGINGGATLPDQLSRTVSAEEYDTVVEHFHATGLHNGWLQELTAQNNYRPDFSAENPFEVRSKN